MPKTCAIPTIQSLLDQMPGQKFGSADFLSNSISSKYYSPTFFTGNHKKSLPCFTLILLLPASLLMNLLKLLDYPFDVIGITETRLYDDDPLVNIDIYGYEFKHTPTTTKCGGAGIYIKFSYDYVLKSDISKSLTDLSESIFTEIKRKGQRNLLVGYIYRHHSPITTFLNEYFSNTLDKLSKQTNKMCVLRCDFNVDLAKYCSHIETDEFYDLISTHGSRPLILQPTRVTSTSATLIDNIFVNDLSSNSFGGDLTSSISDHYFQFSQIDIFPYKEHKNTAKYGRNYRNFNKREFSEELVKIDWSDAIDNGTNGIERNLLLQILDKLLDGNGSISKKGEKKRN